MSEVAASLVAWLVVYTYLVAALTVLVAAIGVPLPSTIVVLAAGSISTDDGPNIWTLFGLILTAAVVGDMVSYSLGRWGGRLMLGPFGARLGMTPARMETATRRFERWGGPLVLVTRFLLTGLAMPTNLAAGASGYPLPRFFTYVVLGEAIWAGQFLALGWVFGPSWVSLLDYLDDTITVLTTLAIAAGLVYLLLELRRSPTPR